MRMKALGSGIRVTGAVVGLLLVLESTAAALGPHEVLLLVNANSPTSKQIANQFARLRQVPPENIVYLPLPDSVLEAKAEISPADFTRWIWDPANTAARKRGVDDHILAWVYSADFPVRITTTPAMSVQGLTFTRNALVDPEVVAKGQYVSPLFVGPARLGDQCAPAHSFDLFRGRLQEAMPLPSMMLALTGSRGLSVDSALRVLSRGALADRTLPRGTVYYVVNDDVRSRCRDWQYKGAQAELAKLNVASQITSNFPAQHSGVLGVFAGLCWVKPSEIAELAPGCIADHLTSFAGVMDYCDHTKLTDWLRAGAAAAAGAVTEPYALWPKFPNARLFVHYASGCTVLESYFQSVGCPLQLLIAGDPLCSPWAPPVTLVLVRVDEGDAAEKVSFHAELFPQMPGIRPEIHYYIDGRTGPVGGTDIDLPTARLSGGYHEVRAVAYSSGPVRQQVFAVDGFEIQRKDRKVTLSTLGQKGPFDLHHPLRVAVSAAGKPSKIAVMAGEQLLAEKADAASAELEVDPAQIGLGSVRLQAAAYYEGGGAVRSAPVPVEFAALDQAPMIAAIKRATNEAGRVVLSADTRDAEHDPVRATWLQAVTDFASLKAGGGSLHDENGAITLTPDAEHTATVVLPPATIDELGAVVSVPADPEGLRTQKAGLVFNYQNAANYDFFGLVGDVSAWTLASCRDGVLAAKITRGSYIQTDKEYALAVRRTKDGVACFVNDECVLQSADVQVEKKPSGLLAAGKPATWRSVRFAPPNLPAKNFDAESDGSLVATSEALASSVVILRVSDGFRSSEKVLPQSVP